MPNPKRLSGPKSKSNPRNSVQVFDKATGKMVSVTIKKILPDDVPTLFSDGILVQHTGEAFFLSFLQTRHALETTEERSRRGDSIEIEQVCLARIVITPIQLAQDLKAIADNFKKWLNKTDLGIADFEEFLKVVVAPSEENNE